MSLLRLVDVDLHPAGGRDLDRLAIVLGERRRRWLWIFKERDKTLRRRLLDLFEFRTAPARIAGNENKEQEHG